MVVNLLLVLFSLAIILFGFGIGSFLSIVGITLISFCAAKGLKTKHKKLIFIFSLVFTTGFLIAMKVLPIAYNETNSVKTFIAPFGLTYYMMQVISYLIDVYRGEVEAETNFIKYALYTTYVPHLFAGPVYNYNEAIDNLFGAKYFSWKNVSSGLLRVAWGAFKVFSVGNRIAILTTSIAQMELGGFYVVIAILFYGIQMFATLSGGVDIALGISKIFDIELPENFNSPFLAESVFDFWERWQITIVAWVQKYIFNSSRKRKTTKARQLFNVLFAYFMIGFLMGEKYILWAIVNGLITLVGDRFKTKKKLLNKILTYFVMAFTWMLVIWPSGLEAFTKFVSIFTTNNIATVFISILNLGLTVADFIIIDIALIPLFVVDNNIERIRKEIKTGSVKVQLTLFIIITLITVFLGVN